MWRLMFAHLLCPAITSRSRDRSSQEIDRPLSLFSKTLIK
ncbi:hypothetical protein CKA32_005142 [Geitlerinema sp. FC II]|nr:hypothetical protein CKA32_005142 [Geitlerinema sp. FC II]